MRIFLRFLSLLFVIQFLAAGSLFPQTLPLKSRLKGNATQSGPEIYLTPTNLDFGEVPIGVPRLDSILVKNTGDSTLNVFVVTAPEFDFSVSPDSAQIAPGDSLFFQAGFAPADTGSQSTKIAFFHNVSATEVLVRVRGNGIFGTPAYDFYPDTLEFDSVRVNTTAQETLVVKNVGTAALSLTASVPVLFDFGIRPDSATVPPGDSAIFSVTFTPMSMGEQFGQILFSTNVPVSEFMVALHGFGKPLTGIAGENVIPNAYFLYDNFPNPFNPATTFRYDLPKSARVKFTIYNMLGQTVATLFDKFQSAGRHQLTLDAAKLTSGVYFYSIEAEGFRKTKKMLLLR